MAALTGDGGAVALRIRHQQLVLQTTATDPLRSNQNQRLPPEGRDFCNLLVDPQLMPIELLETAIRHMDGMSDEVLCL